MTAPRQTLLPLLRRPAPSLDNFVPGESGEALAAVQALLDPGHSGGVVYLWGEPGSGRSHLLTAFATASGCEVLAGERAAGITLATGPVLVVDDVDRLDAEAQVALFDAINKGRQGGWRILLAGPCPPAALTVRGELASRLAQGLVLRLHRLADAEKAAAVTRHAAQLGFVMPTDVIDFLLRHGRRDLGTLLAVTRVLDEVSLRDQRPVSVRLAREVLQSAELFSGPQAGSPD